MNVCSQEMLLGVCHLTTMKMGVEFTKFNEIYDPETVKHLFFQVTELELLYF